MNRARHPQYEGHEFPPETRRRLRARDDARPTHTLLYQLVGAFALLLPMAFLTGQAGPVSLTRVAWASLLFQGIVVSFASYLAWFWLLRRYLASNLAVFSFMTPLFGVTAGILVLRERADVSFAVGAVLVLAGILIVSARGLRITKSPPVLSPDETPHNPGARI